MIALHQRLRSLFEKLDRRIAQINDQRRASGLFAFPKGKIILLGQISLMAQEDVSSVLTLAQTGDVDAFLEMESEIKKELQELLMAEGWIYDEDSPLIWIPPQSNFKSLFELSHISVKVIDAESALVSKAIKAPVKNKQLIREAIVCGKFPDLVNRIEKNGGKLEEFA